MKKILVLGAGLSSSYLIRYLIENGRKEQWFVTVADQSLPLALKKIGRVKHAQATALNLQDQEHRRALIGSHDLVISLMPPTLHVLIAKDCISLGKHLITASYISPEMQKLDAAARKKGLLLLNECGLDPGIDHLSAMKLLQELKEKGARIQSFRSYCGGLVAPEYDDNPWNYKISWNPRNVVLAGNATAAYTEDKRLHFIPYNRIFLQTESVRVKGYGNFEAYANRDSNTYIKAYGIEEAATVFRGTLRRKGYSQSWNHLVKLGLTDDQLILPHSATLLWRDLLVALLPASTKSPEKNLCDFLGIGLQSKEFKKLQWLGLLEPIPLGLEQATPAQALQKLLQAKWKLQKGELDMIVMQHRITYTLQGKEQTLVSSLVVKGEDETYTAIAKTVGLPMAIAAKLVLQGRIKAKGVCMPLEKEFYEPILGELKKYGVEFD